MVLSASCAELFGGIERFAGVVAPVLTAQSSLDAGQIQQKKFKLAMSVGKNRYYPVDSIMPRHFLQTAELAGVGAPLMRTIFEDIAVNAEEQAEAVTNELPRDFPDQLVRSVRAAQFN